MPMRFPLGVLIASWCVLRALTGGPAAYAGQPEIRFTQPVLPPQQATSQSQALQTTHSPSSLSADDPAPRPDALLAPTGMPLPQSRSPQFPRPGIATPSFTQPLANPQVTNQTRQSLGFYGGYSARTTLSQMPRRSPIRTAPALPMQRQLKPFHTVHRDPTVSPYLNLNRNEEDNEAAPNYFAFVRPQLDQLEANRMQQRAIQQLNGQLQSMSSTVVAPGFQSSGMPGTGTPARYMDTAQFYGGWRR